MRIRMLFVLVVVFAVVMGACSAAPAPPTAPAAQPAAQGDAAKGQAAWAQLPCQGCHGANAEGVSGPKLAGTSKSYDQILNKVRKGGGPMPAFTAAQVSDQQAMDIVAWLKSK